MLSAAEVMRRTHNLPPSSTNKLRKWLGDNWKITAAAILVVVAVCAHFSCCDWVRPQVKPSGRFGQVEAVTFDNCIFGMVHAGTWFRESSAGGAWYDLQQATMLGLFLPLLLIIFAGLLVTDTYLPGSCRRVFHLPDYVLRITAVVLFLLSGSSGAIAASHFAESKGVVFVEPQKDTYLIPKPAPAEKRIDVGVNISLRSSRSARSSGGSKAVVPEPSTFVLLGVGGLGLLGYVWRRRRKA